MAETFFERPILNSPYEYLSRHWELDADGQPADIVQGKCRRSDLITPVPKPKRGHGAKFWAHIKGANEQVNPELMRLALKLATGTGKTTVTAMLIAWHPVNAVRHPNSRTFSRGLRFAR